MLIFKEGILLSLLDFSFLSFVEGPCKKTGGLLPPCRFKMSAVCIVVPQPHVAPWICCCRCMCEAHKHEGRSCVVGWYQGEKNRDFWDCGLCCWSRSDLCSSHLSSFGWLSWHPGDIFSGVEFHMCLRLW